MVMVIDSKDGSTARVAAGAFGFLTFSHDLMARTQALNQKSAAGLGKSYGHSSVHSFDV
jgi:hypothetical protein